MYDELCEISKDTFIVEAASEIADRASRFNKGDFDDPDYCKIIISGYCEARRNERRPQADELPWSQDKCQYHYHTELGLPCHASKAS